jgi:hypothetical protein
MEVPIKIITASNPVYLVRVFFKEQDKARKVGAVIGLWT